MTSEIVQLDLEEPRKGRMVSKIVDLLYFYKIGVGMPRDIATKMRLVIEACCTFTDFGSSDSDHSLSSVVANFCDTGEQDPACALLDELDEIHGYSADQCREDDPAGDDADALNVVELIGFVRRTLVIVHAMPNLP